MPSILLVEDSEDIVALIHAHIQDLGFPVQLAIASDGERGLELALKEEFALAILDVDLPLLDGFSICRKIRERGKEMPVLMLTGRDEVQSRVTGLEAGADDYLCKPFSTNELFARIRAILRRSAFNPLGDAANEGSVQADNILNFAELSINCDSREVSLSGKPVKLSKSEFDALGILAGSPGRVFSRADLLRSVLGYENSNYESNINTLMTRLRQKVEPNTASPRFILTEWGVGYRFTTLAELEKAEDEQTEEGAKQS